MSLTEALAERDVRYLALAQGAAPQSDLRGPEQWGLGLPTLVLVRGFAPELAVPVVGAALVRLMRRMETRDLLTGFQPYIGLEEARQLLLRAVRADLETPAVITLDEFTQTGSARAARAFADAVDILRKTLDVSVSPAYTRRCYSVLGSFTSYALAVTEQAFRRWTLDPDHANLHRGAEERSRVLALAIESLASRYNADGCRIWIDHQMGKRRLDGEWDPESQGAADLLEAARTVTDDTGMVAS